jgi:PAS domain S-box-containing protein
MQIVENLSIRNKLILIILSTCGVAVFFTIMSLLLYEKNASQQRRLNDLKIKAEIISSNSTASLLFNDPQAAEEILSALKASPSIRLAALYTADGSLFAAYRRHDIEKDSVPHQFTGKDYVFHVDSINYTHPVIFQGKTIGTLAIQLELKEFYSHMQWYGITAFLLMIASLFLAFLISTKLQKTITGPLLELLNVMKKVSEGKDYTLRAKALSKDETGSLTQGFNDMLEQIEGRDSQLEVHRRHLSALVAQRTSELEVANLQLQKELNGKKLTEEELALEKERLSVTLSSIGEGVITADREGKIVLLNKVAEELTGWTEAEAKGNSLQQVFNIFIQNDRGTYEDLLSKVLQTGRMTEGAPDSLLKHRAGEERFIECNGAPVRNTAGNIIGIVIIFRDMTEKRRLGEEILNAQKLESVGILAGGIAHDFNNLLTAILGNIALAKMRASGEKSIIERLTDAEKASLRARDLTQQLLTFASGGTPVKKIVNLGELIKETVSFALSGSNVNSKLDVPEDLWPAEIDDGQISQVINNLVLNAEQAMPEGGTLLVSCANVVAGKRGTLHIREGRYVRIMIRDQGMGIPARYLNKIFDPYFTTKNKGRGLGLATVYSIIRSHEGHIAVESELGAGTTFTLHLPASASVISFPPAQQQTLPEGKGRVLVMDDEDMVREVAGRALQHLGYDVEGAVDGDEAIGKFREAHLAGKPFIIVLMDLTIPGGMGGQEAIKHIREIDPAVKAIVMSGYANAPIMADFRSFGFSGTISKPFKVDDLSEVLQQVMHEES